MSDNHCKDCCCARSWTALGITEYTGKAIPEHIEELRAVRDSWHEAYVKARNDLLTATALLEGMCNGLDFMPDRVAEFLHRTTVPTSGSLPK